MPLDLAFFGRYDLSEAYHIPYSWGRLSVLSLSGLDTIIVLFVYFARALYGKAEHTICWAGWGGCICKALGGKTGFGLHVCMCRTYGFFGYSACVATRVLELAFLCLYICRSEYFHFTFHVAFLDLGPNSLIKVLNPAWRYAMPKLIVQRGALYQGVSADATQKTTPLLLGSWHRMQVDYVQYVSSLQGYSAHTAAPTAATSTHVVDTASRFPEPFSWELPRLMPSGKPCSPNVRFCLIVELTHCPLAMSRFVRSS